MNKSSKDKSDKGQDRRKKEDQRKSYTVKSYTNNDHRKNIMDPMREQFKVKTIHRVMRINYFSTVMLEPVNECLNANKPFKHLIHKELRGKCYRKVVSDAKWICMNKSRKLKYQWRFGY